MSEAFATARLSAEPLAPGHEEEIARLHADERVMATMGGTATPAESRAWLERNLQYGTDPGGGVFVFRDRETGEFIGRGAVRRIEIGGRREVEIGYALVPERWGAGLATEMALGLAEHAERHGHRDLIAYTEPGHAASRRVMEKAGFRYERAVEHHRRAQVVYRRASA
jgi:ribosomal-protein-alanine N-acetyltransferase